MRHLEELRRRLREWAERVRDGASEEQFAAEAEADLAADRDAYEQAMPFWQSYAGLKRYWEKRALRNLGPLARARVPAPLRRAHDLVPRRLRSRTSRSPSRCSS